MISIIMLCYKRFENLEEIIQSWLDQDEVSEFILCDNSGTQWKTDLPITVLNSSKNYGTYIRYVAPLLAKNQLICWSDDDLIVKKGLIEDLLKVWTKDRLVGIIGRKFAGFENYYAPNGVRAKKIYEPVQVDYLCGLILLSHKKNFIGFDPMQIPTRFFTGKQIFVMGDWWWEHWLQERNKDLTMWVANTDKFTLLEESKDEGALHTGEEFQAVREYYFRKWILKTEERNLDEIDFRLTSTS